MKNKKVFVIVPDQIFQRIKKLSDKHGIRLFNLLPFLLLLGVETFEFEMRFPEEDDPE